MEGLFQVRVIDWYTKDEKGTFGKDEELARFLYMPKGSINFDLNRSHPEDRWKEADHYTREQNLDTLLEWIVKNCNDARGRPKRLEAEFASFRGMLRKIMCAQYEKNRSESLKICAIKAKGTIYLCRFYTAENEQNCTQQNEDHDQVRFTKYGRVFEHYMVSNRPGVKPDVRQPLSEFQEFCCVYKSRFGVNSMIYCAEVNGLGKEEDLKQIDRASLYELKTCKEKPNPYSLARYKKITWWAQSVLAKIDSVVVGYRNDSGFVREVEVLPVHDIPRQAKGWDANSCMLFLQDFLRQVKDEMMNARKEEVFEFTWYPGQTHFSARKLPRNNDCYFIPEWYLQWLKNMP
ncbi:decapping and exoribonuclease protein-like [Neocloeon triangulifer]|uniref:decapping and exoribonuclease protein-like n=1 Tax=Neocloeon triangulifer TaxID=2078957 RepID=UPI00286F75FB|nr:decapping and exoribonuclease protein-like [Neocloeon triangulifer]